MRRHGEIFDGLYANSNHFARCIGGSGGRPLQSLASVFLRAIGNVPDRFSNESRGLNAERTRHERASVRERGHGGLRGKRTGYIEIKGLVISSPLSPLRWLGPTQITELASASATGPSSRELTLNTATQPASVLSRPSALPDSLRSEEESPFLWKIAEKLRA